MDLSHTKLRVRILVLLIFVGAIIGCCLFLFFKLNPFDESKVDKQYEKYSFYVQAVGLAVTDVDKALDLCSESSNTDGECFKEVAEIISEKDFKKSLDICETINNTVWKDECFFAVAESLFDKNLSLASEVCKKSKKFSQHCYNHIGEFIEKSFDNSSFAVFACENIPVEFRGNCFWGFGNSIGQNLGGDVDSAISACNQVPVEFRSNCFDGLGSSFGKHFKDNSSFAVFACEKVPFEFRSNCFWGFGGSIGEERFGGDVDSAISACNQVPVEFRNDCFASLSSTQGYLGNISSCLQFENPYDITCFLSFGKKEGVTFSEEKIIKCDSIANETLLSWFYRGFGRGLSEHFLDNISLAFDVCSSYLNDEYKFNCYKGISEGIGDLFLGTNSFSVLNKCSKLNKFSSYCFERAGRKAVNLYSYNLSKAFNACYGANESFRNSCFIGLGKGLGEEFLTNLSFASMKCDELPSPYNTDCKQGVDEIIKVYDTS